MTHKKTTGYNGTQYNGAAYNLANDAGVNLSFLDGYFDGSFMVAIQLNLNSIEWTTRVIFDSPMLNIYIDHNKFSNPICHLIISKLSPGLI